MNDGPDNLAPDAAKPSADDLAVFRAQSPNVLPANVAANVAMPERQPTADDLAVFQAKTPNVQPAGSWSSRTYHGILNALGGQYDTTYTATPNGVVQQQVAQTPGQQWKRIISGALAGFSGAAAAGTTGPGGTMRGLGGGIQAGYQQRLAENKNQQELANKQFDQQQQAAMNKANVSLMAANVARSNWELSHQQAEAYKSDLTNEANLMKIYEDAKADGAVDLGVMPTFQDAIEKFNNDPTLHDKHVQGQIVPTAHVNASGVIDGVHAIWVPAAWQNRKATENFTYDQLVGYDKNDKPMYQPMTVGRDTNMTNMELQTFKIAHGDQVAKQHLDKIQAENVQSETKVREQLAPAQRAKDWAEAENARAEASDRLFSSGTTPESQQVVDAIGTGHVTVQRLGQLISKPEGQKLLGTVMAKYPDFDQGKVQGYIHAVQDFTDTKLGTAGGNLRTVGGAMMQLKRIKDLNTGASLIYGTPANTAYKDMVHNAAPEIAKFYGTSTKEGIANIENELLSTTPWNRNSAIQTQAQAVGDVIDRYDQSWQNAAPSPRYEAPMPGLSQDVKEARALLDPDYAQRYHAAPSGGAGTTGTAGPSGGAGSAGNSGMIVSLADARKLPENKDKTDAQISADIQSHGHQVGP